MGLYGKQKRIVNVGDTVCLKFVDTGKQAVYTIAENDDEVNLTDLSRDEGVVSRGFSLARAVLGKKANETVAFTYNDNVVSILILSFFRKTSGIYQRMREQKESKNTNSEQPRQQEKVQSQSYSGRVRAIRTGCTVCVEFLDTKEKQAFKIVEAWTMAEDSAKPFRPASYDSKTVTQANPDEATISENSPLAKALFGKHRGDIVKYKVGDQTNEVRVIAFFDNDQWLKKHNGVIE